MLFNNFNFIKTETENTGIRKIETERLITLWAVSEAFLGGILHAFKIPFTGLVIGSTAVIIMTLISIFSHKKGLILKATLIVIIVKGIFSPHTPFTAYLAVFIQGLAGELLFSSGIKTSVSVFILAFFTNIYSGVQKIFVLTVIFGKNLWESIDSFVNFVVLDFFGFGKNHISFSFWLVFIYLGIHLIAGFITGVIALRISKNMMNRINSGSQSGIVILSDSISNMNGNIVKKRKKWWLRVSGMILFIFFASLLVLTYLTPENFYVNRFSVLFMFIRAVLILFVWYKFISPLLFALSGKFLKKKKDSYYQEIERVITLFPLIKYIIAESWQKSSGHKKIRRMKIFINDSIFTLLTGKIN